ncbi:hypothetical protein [Actibacterium sp. 188UL27-1]|uniref:hypothetical protein n=1 Tax=Actibacterium sp. 188UL27-1 TaxID=2786961 RepID=UPI00195948EA|nr:hypothetical protein [Actibacterium sp. 188UL27-1]
MSFCVALVARPPGAMVLAQGTSITYVICAGDTLRTIVVPTEDGGRETVTNSNCDFLATQGLAILERPTRDEPRLLGMIAVRWPDRAQLADLRPMYWSHDTRGPPRLS